MNSVTLRVNGVEVTRTVAPRMHLADFVREELNLTGTHLGCEHGVCGACTIMLDGRPVRSCISYAVACAGSDVRTVEAFDEDPLMALLRGAFSRHHALQCGYCTPGMLATAYDIVTRLPRADEARIREELSGNLCRCTGYVGIVSAIREVLDSGPHQSALRAAAAPLPPVAATSLAFGTAPRVASEPGIAAAPSVPLPERLEGGTTLTRSIPVPVPVDRLWATLQDIGTIARCLPGATIESIEPDGRVAGAFQVAIGPMRAQFRGKARVSFDPSAQSGKILGAGGDGLSRSRAEGAIRFAARPSGGGARLDLDITYKLSGPLAQLGRPMVVANVVDQLLGDAARNLAHAALGGTPIASTPIGGIRLLFRMLLGTVRGLLSSP